MCIRGILQVSQQGSLLSAGVTENGDKESDGGAEQTRFYCCMPKHNNDTIIIMCGIFLG